MNKLSIITLCALSMSGLMLLNHAGAQAIEGIGRQGHEAREIIKGAESDSAPLEHILHLVEQKHVGAAIALGTFYSEQQEYRLRDEMILNFLKDATDLDSHLVLSYFETLFDNKALAERVSKDFDEVGDISELTLILSANPTFGGQTSARLLKCHHKLKRKYESGRTSSAQHIEYMVQKKISFLRACSF